MVRIDQFAQLSEWMKELDIRGDRIAILTFSKSSVPDFDSDLILNPILAGVDRPQPAMKS